MWILRYLNLLAQRRAKLPAECRSRKTSMCNTFYDKRPGEYMGVSQVQLSQCVSICHAVTGKTDCLPTRWLQQSPDAGACMHFILWLDPCVVLNLSLNCLLPKGEGVSCTSSDLSRWDKFGDDWRHCLNPKYVQNKLEGPCYCVKRVSFFQRRISSQKLPIQMTLHPIRCNEFQDN